MDSESINLRAGPLELFLDGPDLRYVSFEGEEIVRRIYMAVRDPDWDTIAAVEHERDVDRRDDSFSVRMSLSNRGGQVALDWELEIEGTATGELEYVMRAQAMSDFEYAKIGICVHHPIAGVAGRRWKSGAHGSPASGVMSDLIYPQVPLRDLGVDMPMIPPLDELTIDQEAGTVSFDFDGDLYETEDQRNWSDASFKTYSMPAFTGYQHSVVEGQHLDQRVRLSFEAHRDSPHRATRRYTGPHADEQGRLELGPALGRSLPEVGIGLGATLVPAGDERLDLLRPSHLRLDLDLGAEAWEEQLMAALATCAQRQAGLELALFPSGDPRFDAGGSVRPLERIADAVVKSGVRLARVLVFPAAEEASPTAWVRLVRESLPIEARVGGGTNLYFNELFRSLPDLSDVPVVAWSLTPQVHAFTDGDLVENLEGQSEQVRTARAFAGDRELCVSPITLKPRFNPNAREGAQAGDNVDPRQSSLFAAAWTVGSAKQISEGGVASITYYEVAGPRGLLEGRDTFPVFHAIADLASLRGGELLQLQSGEEPWLGGMAVRSEGTLVALIANLGRKRRSVEVRLGEADSARLRLLDHANEALARESPSAFRAHHETVEADDGAFKLELDAYATARLELI